MFERLKNVCREEELMKSESVKYYIDKLELVKHPEGGYFKEVYRSAEHYYTEGLPERYGGDRSFSTSIYFLLEGRQVSRFHKLKSDEIWHFLDGSPSRIYLLDRNGNLSEIVLGKNLNSGEMLQVVIEKENWFAAEVKEKDSFSLVSCTVAPGFDYKDFELGRRDELIRMFPGHKELIDRFTTR
jgi:uncharacterized protein